MSRKRILTICLLTLCLALVVKISLDPAVVPAPAVPGEAPEVEETAIPAYPRRYALGRFDERFGISRERFLEIVAEAKKVWETAAGRDLFDLQQNSVMKVNLVFDWREEALLKAKEQRARLDENGSSFDMLKTEYERNTSALERKRSEYDEAAQAYKVHLDDYNARVKRWNDGENHSEGEEKALQSKRQELDEELARLEPKRTSLASEAAALNALGERLTALARKFNMEVELFNGTYVSQREFEKGTFDGRNIDIYEFDKEEDLRIALVHEFGHALGLEHVDNPRSIMYRKLAAQDMNDIHLTSDDLTQLLSKLK
jgi:hypothetical protein